MYEIIYIYIAIIIAIIARIWIMNGYSYAPFYKDGVFQLNIIGTIVVGVITAYTLMVTNPALFTDPFIAFVTVYSVPHLFDNILTKLTPTPTEPAEAEEKVEEKEEEGGV